MSIKLNELIKISKEEYNDWTICLNRGESDFSETLNTDNMENYYRIMRHISYKKGLSQSKSFRVIHTKYCLQFVGLHNDKRYSNWLFLGAFEVGEKITNDDGHESYEMKKMDCYSNFDERLVIEYKKHQGDKQAKLNIKNIESIDVFELLSDKYVKLDKEFPGYKNFSCTFAELASKIRNNSTKWRDSLSAVKCIYAITDTNEDEKKIYVGGTYGEGGVWQRWSSYVYTNGHGGNVQLKELIDKDPQYAYKHFRFSILEYFYDPTRKEIEERENAWKVILQARDLGYNEN